MIYNIDGELVCYCEVNEVLICIFFFFRVDNVFFFLLSCFVNREVVFKFFFVSVNFFYSFKK